MLVFILAVSLIVLGLILFVIGDRLVDRSAGVVAILAGATILSWLI